MRYDKFETLLKVYKDRNYFMEIYLVKKDVDIQSIVLDKNETIDANGCPEKNYRLWLKIKK